MCSGRRKILDLTVKNIYQNTEELEKCIKYMRNFIPLHKSEFYMHVYVHKHHRSKEQAPIPLSRDEFNRVAYSPHISGSTRIIDMADRQGRVIRLGATGLVLDGIVWRRAKYTENGLERTQRNTVQIRLSLLVVLCRCYSRPGDTIL